jgi:two-component system CheB/CheR fusion protein
VPIITTADWDTLMYFSPSAQERIVADFPFALTRQGYLIVGKGEALQNRQHMSRGVPWPSQNGDASSFDVEVAPLVGSDHSSLVGIGVTFLDAMPHRMLQDELEQARRELETAYEELQATVKELETTNQELQSTNRELETTYEELHSANEELETMDREMRERTDEAVRANAFLHSVLASLLHSIVLVDRDLRVTAWSTRSAELWGLREDEVEGEDFLNLKIGLPVGELRAPIRAVLGGSAVDEIELEGHDSQGRAVRATVSLSPLHGPAGELIGVILAMDAGPSS